MQSSIKESGEQLMISPVSTKEEETYGFYIYAHNGLGSFVFSDFIQLSVVNYKAFIP